MDAEELFTQMKTAMNLFQIPWNSKEELKIKFEKDKIIFYVDNLGYVVNAS